MGCSAFRPFQSCRQAFLQHHRDLRPLTPGRPQKYLGIDEGARLQHQLAGLAQPSADREPWAREWLAGKRVHQDLVCGLSIATVFLRFQGKEKFGMKRQNNFLFCFLVSRSTSFLPKCSSRNDNVTASEPRKPVHRNTRMRECDSSSKAANLTRRFGSNAPGFWREPFASSATTLQSPPLTQLQLNRRSKCSEGDFRRSCRPPTQNYCHPRATCRTGYNYAHPWL